MVKQKAIVNEESNNAEYWKRKYVELLKRSPNLSEIRKPESSCKSVGPTPSWNQVLTSQLMEKDSQLIEAHQELKHLITQEKESHQTLSEMQAIFRSANQGMQQFKSQLNFRIKMAQSREQTLLADRLKGNTN